MKQNVIYSNDFLQKRCGQIDRRNLSFNSFLVSAYKGRRVKVRRQAELEQGYYTDIYEKWVGLNALAIILLSAFDAFFTLNILERGGVEVNPFMLALLAYDTQVFLITKMSITIACVFFVLIHINFQMLRFFSVKLALKCILAFYVILIGYEVFLLTVM